MTYFSEILNVLILIVTKPHMQCLPSIKTNAADLETFLTELPDHLQRTMADGIREQHNTHHYL